MKSLRGHHRQILVEAQQQNPVHAGLADQVQLFTRPGQARRGLFGTEIFQRLRLEGDHQRGQAMLRGPLPERGKHGLVTEMHTVEVTDGRHASPVFRTQIVLSRE